MHCANYADLAYSKFSRHKATSNFTTSNYFVIDDLQTILYLFININQLDALNFIISLFQASTCFEQMCSKHVEA